MRSGARLKITLIVCAPRSSGGGVCHPLAPSVVVGLQPLHRAHDGLLDRERRAPPERPDARGVEMDQGTVAGPATLPAGVNHLGRERELIGADRYRFTDD